MREIGVTSFIVVLMLAIACNPRTREPALTPSPTIPYSPQAKPSSTESPRPTDCIPSSMSAEEVMNLRPFIRTNPNLFSTYWYPQSIDYAVPAAPQAEPVVRNELEQFLQGKVAAERLQELMGMFDNSDIKAICPDPTLRAAVLSLAPTSFSTAIDAIFGTANTSGKPYLTVDYVSTASARPLPLAAAQASARFVDGAFRRQILFQYWIRNEPFPAIGALIAHESMHQGKEGDPGYSDTPLAEEVIANFVQMLAWSQMLELDPSLARHNSRLVRDENEGLYAILNSGQGTRPSVGILQASGIENIFPGSRASTERNVAPNSFLQSIDVAYYCGPDALCRSVLSFASATPGHAVAPTRILGDYLQNIFQDTKDAPQTLGGIIDRLDGKNGAPQKIISPEDAVKLARILQLRISKPNAPTPTSAPTRTPGAQLALAPTQAALSPRRTPTITIPANSIIADKLSIEEIRTETGVKPLDTTEWYIYLNELPNEIYGYSLPLQLAMLSQRKLDKEPIEPKPDEVPTAEIQKALTGQIFVVGFVTPEVAAHLQTLNSGITITLRFQAGAAFTHPVAIQDRRIVSWDEGVQDHIHQATVIIQ